MTVDWPKWESQPLRSMEAASRPTRDYDPEYGADKGFWTTDMFVEAVYKSLKK